MSAALSSSWLDATLALERSPSGLGPAEMQDAWEKLAALTHDDRKQALAGIMAMHELHGHDRLWHPVLAQLAVLGARLIQSGAMVDAEHHQKTEQASKARRFIGA